MVVLIRLQGESWGEVLSLILNPVKEVLVTILGDHMGFFSLPHQVASWEPFRHSPVVPKPHAQPGHSPCISPYVP